MKEKIVEILVYICLFTSLFAIGYMIKQKQHKTDVHVYVRENLESYVQTHIEDKK